MIINSHSLRLKKLFHLIEIEFTGKPDQLSILLGVSQRALARYLDILRELGADIRYSRSMETYYFGSPPRIEISRLFFKNDNFSNQNKDKVIFL